MRRILLFHSWIFWFSASRNEGLGLVQVEAMGYGIPVLGRDVGGITEILENGYNGFVIEDEYDLATKNQFTCY